MQKIVKILNDLTTSLRNLGMYNGETIEIGLPIAIYRELDRELRDVVVLPDSCIKQTTLNLHGINVKVTILLSK